MRVRVKLKKMSQPEAQFISLVRRGANQLPFRIQKADEETMSIDLSSLQRIFKKAEAPKPGVAAVVVHKSDDMEPVKAALVAGGFSVENAKENEDGTVVFKQGESEDGTIVRVSENVIVVIKHADEVALNPLKDILGTEGYVADLAGSAAALPDLIVKAAGEAKTQDEFRASIEKLVQAFAQAAPVLSAIVPVGAYQLDSAIVAKAAKPTEQPPESEKPESECSECTPEAKCAKHTPSQKEADAAPAEAPVVEEPKGDTIQGVIKTEEKAPEAAPVEEKPAEPVEKAAEEPKAEVVEKADPMAPVLAALAALTAKLDAIENVQKSQGEKLDGTIATLEEKVQTAVAKADASEKKLKGVVIAPPPSGDRVQKSDKAPEIDPIMQGGVFDSSIHRRR